MKGIVFSESLELVEEKFGLETVDHLIESTELASGGAYTAVGTYPHSEMVALVVALSQKSGIPVPDLLKVFGHHLFNTFNKNYSVFFEGVEHPYDLLEKSTTTFMWKSKNSIRMRNFLASKRSEMEKSYS